MFAYTIYTFIFIGRFIRKMRLTFRKLSFSETFSAWHAMIEYKNSAASESHPSESMQPIEPSCFQVWPELKKFHK